MPDALSNERLVALQQGQVAFRVRDNAHAGKKRIERIAADTFIGRFLQHVLSPGFKRIRHDGILANGHKRHKLAQCRAALQMPVLDPVVMESVAAFMLRVAQIDLGRCPHCAGGQLHVMGVIAPHPLPSWPCRAKKRAAIPVSVGGVPGVCSGNQERLPTAHPGGHRLDAKDATFRLTIPIVAARDGGSVQQRFIRRCPAVGLRMLRWNGG